MLSAAPQRGSAQPILAESARPSRPGPSPARRRAPRPDSLGATFALTALTLASSVGLDRVFSGGGWIGPVVLAALAVHLLCLFARRRRAPAWASVPAGLVMVWLLGTWTVLGYTTRYGIPTGRSFSVLATSISQIGVTISSTVVPVRVTPGFALLALGGTAAVAALGDWLAFSRRSALYGAAPAFGYFVVCCILGQGTGRQWAVAIEVAALMLYLLVHTASVAHAGQAWFGNRRRGALRWGLTSGSLLAAAGMIVALAIAPAIKGNDGNGLLSWRGSLPGGGGAPREVANPIVSLQTRLITDSATPVFTVESPVPSYWRLTALNTFTGQDWISTYLYQGFRQRLPGVGAVPPGTRTVQETFNLENLDSVWLPVAFTPVSVSGVSGVSYDPASGSLIILHGANSNDLNYSVESYQYLSNLDPTELEGAPPLRDTSSLSEYLSLPSSVPPTVYALARQITASATTEYGKALALQDFFLGSSFTYSLDPPDNGYGISSLVNFLFNTRTGYCQQFAGAYAVLARAIGLPTRLAFGFATGAKVGPDTYQVDDADAHTWPEVYFGPQFGWLPFEPTKGFADPIAASYAGNGSPNSTADGGSGLSSPSAAPHNGVQQGPGQDSAKHTRTPGRTTSSNTTVAAAPSGSSGGPNPWWVLALAVIGIGAWMGLNSLLRRARWRLRRRRARGDPAAQVLTEWRLVSELLAWWGIRPREGETPIELSRRAGAAMMPHLREPSPWLPGGLTRLARLVSEASFAPNLPSGRSAEAEEVAREVHQRMVRSADSRLLLAWAMAPVPGRWGSGNTDDAP